jgi:hypothetical protein
MSADDTPPMLPPRAAIEGSRIGRDDGRALVSFARLRGRRLVVREKLDGLPVVLWCRDGAALTSHAGDPAVEGWLSRRGPGLVAALGGRLALAGVWLQRARSVYYDALPDLLVVEDVFDLERGHCLAGAARREVLARASLADAPRVHDGSVASLRAVHALVGRSQCKSERWRDALRLAAAEDAGVLFAIDPLDLAMGLLVDIDDDDVVEARLDFVRPSHGSAVSDECAALVTNGVAPDGA